MKQLGIVFIVIGVLCAIGGFTNTEESRFEAGYRDSAAENRKLRDASEALDSLARASGMSDPYDSTRKADRLASQASDSYLSLRDEREGKMKWFFIAAVGFVVLGLILTVSAPPKPKQEQKL